MIEVLSSESIRMKIQPPLLLHDGDCGFCTGWVMWIVMHEKDPFFSFQSLQDYFGHERSDLDTIILIYGKLRPKCL